MNDIRVSVIIPVYNVEQYLRQCLDSVINQTFKDIEIIVINDCSPDNSLQIIKEYQQKDNRIVLVDLKQNVGLGFARNEGIKIAKGKYITFVDSDDWITQNYVKILYNNIVKFNCSFVSITCFPYDDTTKKIKHNKANNILYINKKISDEITKKIFLTNSNIWAAWSKIFRRDFLLENNIKFEKYIMEDIPFVYKAIIYSESFIFLPYQEYFYRKNRIGSITSKVSHRIYAFLTMFMDLKNFLINKEFYSIYKNSFLTLVANTIAFEFEEETIPLKETKIIFMDIKNKFFNKNPKFIYTKKLLYNIRLSILKTCLFFNLNYALIARPLKRFFKFFHIFET